MAVCRYIGSSEFDYAAPGAISVKIILLMLFKKTYLCVSIILKIATFGAHILKCVEGNALFPQKH